MRKRIVCRGLRQPKRIRTQFGGCARCREKRVVVSCVRGVTLCFSCLETATRKLFG